MEGGGMYNKFSAFQLKTFEESKEFLLSNINNQLKINKNKPISIADLGCSQGKNSIIMMDFLLRSILNKPEVTSDSTNQLEFLVCHEDQPINDWLTLLNTINSNESYVNTIKNVYNSVINKSFYNRLFPSKYIDMFVSFVALHWLDNPPALPRNRIGVRVCVFDSGHMYSYVWYILKCIAYVVYALYCIETPVLTYVLHTPTISYTNVYLINTP